MKDPFKPHRRKKKRTPLTSPREVQSPHTQVMSSPISDESGTTTDVQDDPESSQSQENQSIVTDFSPGSKLEVMDFNEKWYPVKVVEVDYEEGEVLVHFEKWSDRYDEWVPMDSNRIRQPVLSHTSPVVKKVFSVNEKVIAVWAYNHKYPATVKKILPNDKYEVLFSDGYTKILRGCKLFKASEEDLKNVQLPPPKKPAPPMGADPLDPDLGPKEERRLKKRRLDVLEAYLPHKKQKIESPQPTSDTSPQPSTSSYRPKEMPKVVLKTKGRPSLRNKRRTEHNDEEDDDDLIEDEEEEEESEEEEEEKEEDDDDDESYDESKPKKGNHKKWKRRKTKGLLDGSRYVYRPKQKQESKEESERWNVEIPAGASPVQIKNHEGCRESVIIPDKKLPPGWTKHTLPRKKGAKWDVLLVNPEGRKFRSRTDLRNYFAEKKKPFPEDCFDFMVGRKMEMIKTQLENRKKLAKDNEGSPSHRTSDGESKRDSKTSNVSKSESKRIKTMMPKSRLSDGLGEGKEETSGALPATPTPPFALADVRNPEGGFTCCGKSFRKENLFQMHMKHYHPEYSNLFGSTPNVADLAYARTVGEPLEDSRAEEMTPKSSLVERVTKYEAERKAQSEPTETIATSTPITTPDKSAAIDPTPSSVITTPETADTKDVEEKTGPSPTLSATVMTEDDPSVTLTDEELIENQLSSLKRDQLENDKIEKLKENETVVPAVDETKEMKEVANTMDVPTATPDFKEEKQMDLHDDKVEDPPVAALELKVEEPSSEPVVPQSPPLTAVLPTPPLPVIKPVSKMTTGSSKTTVTSEAVIVQTTSSAKAPVTITKYVPPGQKPSASSTTKVTISLPLVDKENKPTIKTLLPMRPPTSEAQEIQKPKEIKPKEESVEETPVKSKPRKRTVSESLPKKPKLVKPSTGSLEEEPAMDSKVPSSPSTNTSYRFSRNRTLPHVSLEKLNVTPNMNGSVVVSTAEDKITNTAGRRLFKNFKAANKINKKRKDVESSEETTANLSQTVTEASEVYENLRKEEIINCICGYMEEDGLMIQCDLCLCWQHGMCNNIDKEEDVPEKYVCYICQHPARQRSSTVHRHNQDWLKEGHLPSLSFQPQNKGNIIQQEAMLKKSHDLISSLLQLQTVIQSLRVKTHIATKPDHPKLYLWAKSWKNDGSDTKRPNVEDNLNQEVSGPQPEAAIDETECRLQLLEHVEDYQNQVEDRLTSIQAQIADLESEDPDLASDETSDHYPVTKQTVQMVLRDLNTVRKVAALN